MVTSKGQYSVAFKPGRFPLMSEQGENTAIPKPDEASSPAPANSLPSSSGAEVKHEPDSASPTPGGNGKAGEAQASTGPSNKKWYVVKVQSGREESIKEAIE